MTAQPPPSGAALAWRPAPAPLKYQINGTTRPGTAAQATFTRELQFDFAAPGKVVVTGTSIAPPGQTLDFNPATLATTTATDTFVPGDATWFALPRNAASVAVGGVFTDVNPKTPAANAIVIQDTGRYTITGVTAAQIRYRVVHSTQLLRNAGLRKYSQFLSGTPSGAPALQKFAVLGQKAPIADCQGTFDRNGGFVDSLDCVWQPFPGRLGWTLTALKASPDRTQLFIRRVP